MKVKAWRAEISCVGIDISERMKVRLLRLYLIAGVIISAAEESL